METLQNAVRTEVFNMREIAGYLGMHVSTLYRLVKRGALPGFKVGRDWRFRREAIDDWCAAREAHQFDMSLREVASYLRIHEATVRRLLRQGKLPASRVGHDWRFSRDAIHSLARPLEYQQVAMQDRIDNDADPFILALRMTESGVMSPLPLTSKQISRTP